MITRIKGMQDFIDTKLFNYAIHSIHMHLQRYNFSQINTPIIENIELFKRSLGNVTDVVNKEMFIIQPAKDDAKEVLCLRPEATASTVRAFIENNITVTPWKVFSTGPMFRYERPQKGRYRQFYQTTVEIIGAANIVQDAQLIMMFDHLFRHVFSLDSYTLAINFLGSYEDRAAYIHVLKTFLNDQAHALCALCVVRKDSNPMRVFDCKNNACQMVYRSAPYIVDHLSAESMAQWKQLQEYLHVLGVPFVYTPTLVRGLDYYNKTVFEFSSTQLGAQSTFCGGGRYDSLVTMLGGQQDTPALGAAIGIERLLLLLEPMQHLLELSDEDPLILVVPFTQEQQRDALLCTVALRDQGLRVDLLADGGSIKKMMKMADKLGASFVALIGEDEQKEGKVLLKNMLSGVQTMMNYQDVRAYVQGVDTEL